ncbi:MAG: DUF4157 domain-containing protein [Nitrospira sp.]|nr:DUF4157 domain-containing protein [Nitrospira sp.]
MSKTATLQTISRDASSPSSGYLLQRACACGGAAGLAGECEECKTKKLLGKPLQTKLAVSQPGDEFEQEADRVAEQVMRMPDSEGRPGVAESPRAPLVQRHVNGSGTAGVGTASPLVHDVLNSPGQPLDAATRAFFEPRFGHDFGRVRVHADAGAETSARSINARAYTVGHHIAFGTGRFAPGTGEGNRLLAHELSHVVQQAGEQSTIMRVCDCASFGGRQPDPTDPREAGVSQAFPGLVSGDWCVIEPSTPTYNCFAWSVSDKTQWLDPVPQIDNLYGNGDGKPSFADFDAFYAQTHDLYPQTAPDSNTLVALFAKGTIPVHAALTAGAETCGTVPFTSKLGQGPLIAHDLYQLEGAVYGKAVRFYG